MTLTLVAGSKNWKREGWTAARFYLDHAQRDGWERGNFFIHEVPTLVAGKDVILAAIVHASRERITLATDLDVAAECVEIAERAINWARVNTTPGPGPIRSYHRIWEREIYAAWRMAGFVQSDVIAERHFVWARRNNNGEK